MPGMPASISYRAARTAGVTGISRMGATTPSSRNALGVSPGVTPPARISFFSLAGSAGSACSWAKVRALAPTGNCWAP
jgi:hypothetical protein